MRRAPVALGLLLALVGCGSGGGDSGSDDPTTTVTVTETPSKTPTSEPSPTVPPDTDDPMVEARYLESQINAITVVIQITEDNDTNDLIGRPGQYDAAVFMGDKRQGCSASDDYDGLSIDCGAKIERWASREDAEARAADIQAKLKQFGLGAEWDFVRGRMLLRVAGDIKPSDVDAYREAWLRNE